MADRVTEIEQHAKSGLLFRILFDDGGFDPQIAEDEFRGDRRIEAENLVDVLLLPGEEFFVADQGVFDSLCDPGFDIAEVQCRKAIRIDGHEHRLMKGSHKVLARRQVDGRLTADGRVDVSFQGRRENSEANASHPRGGRKPSQIADYTAAQCHDNAVSIHSVRGQRFVELL